MTDMTDMAPMDMAKRLGGGLLSFPVAHFDADGNFWKRPTATIAA